MKVLSPLAYYLFIKPLSWLPFPLLYFFSTITFFLLYHCFGYRKKVVRNNLKNAFPQLNEKERSRIEKNFYLHFSDFLMESVKSISISDKKIQQRCKIINPELINDYYDKGKHVIITSGHYNNWEYYAVGVAQQLKHQIIAAYKPLSNVFFDRKVLQSRQRFGMKLIPMKNIPRCFNQLSSKEPTLSVMINDQSPGNPQAAHWNTFLNQETGWKKGPEKLAKKYDHVVLFACIRKKKRGFYEVTFYPITDNPHEEKEGFITDKHTAYLEEAIKEEPAYWLWSHRRWKHKRS